MTLSLKKLCVGIKDLEQLASWQTSRSYKYKTGQMAVNHVTRNFPKRMDELLDGGSLYWVVKGNILARNNIIALDESTDDEGKKWCVLVLSTPFIMTEPQPHRPFQGWRYFTQDLVPADVNTNGANYEVSQEMLVELQKLGLL